MIYYFFFYGKFGEVVQLISQLRGYFYVNPILALSLAITIFSFVGVNENAHNLNNRLIPKIPI